MSPEPPAIRAARLAADRTTVAGWRTLMAYERTGLGMLLLGVAMCWHLPAWHLAGLALAIAGTGLIALGRWRHRAITRRIATVLAAIERITGEHHA